MAERHLKEAVMLERAHWHAPQNHSHCLLAHDDGAANLESSRAALTCDPVDPPLNVRLAWHRRSTRDPEKGLRGLRGCVSWRMREKCALPRDTLAKEEYVLG